MHIERVLANNPGPFTGPGTNTWILDDGTGHVAIVDPGPIDPQHGEAIVARVGSRQVGLVLVTHTHSDHAPLASPLARDLGIATAGYQAGPGFQPDLLVDDGSVVEVGSLSLEVIHTPGHSLDHVCFRAGDVLFSGDHIMGGSSVVVEEMGPYLASLEKLRGQGLKRICPGHGEEAGNADEVIEWYLAHRRQRHTPVMAAVSEGRYNVEEIVESVYVDTDSSLHPLAAISVRAHLALLAEEGRIVLEDDTVVEVSEAP